MLGWQLYCHLLSLTRGRQYNCHANNGRAAPPSPPAPLPKEEGTTPYAPSHQRVKWKKTGAAKQIESM
jgi:hypothetical protein